jgi:hypothetical protein
VSTLPPYAEPQFNAEEAPIVRRTSTLAVTGLVLSVLACCPLVGLIGPLLGLIALILILMNPALKGAVIAIAAIVIGLALQAAVFVGLGRVYTVITERPQEFVVAIEAGDWTAARAAAGGAAAAATDDEFAAFAAALEDQYGAITAWELIPPPPGTQPDPSSQSLPWSYLVTTEKAGRATVEFDLLMVDEVSQQFLWRPSAMTIRSNSGGADELTFPPAAPTPPALPEAAEAAAGGDGEAGEAGDDGGGAP